MKNGIKIKQSVSVVLLFIIFLSLGFKASGSADFFKTKHICSQQKAAHDCDDKNDQSPCEESEKETDTESEDGDDIFERFFISCLIFNEPFDLELNSSSALFSFYSSAFNAVNPHTPVYLSNRILRL